VATGSLKSLNFIGGGFLAKKKKPAKKRVTTVKEILDHQSELELSIKELGEKIKNLPHDPTHQGGPTPGGGK
jgi:hypothetical protein